MAIETDTHLSSRNTLLPCILPLVDAMFVVYISDGCQQDKEVTVHAKVAPRVWLVEEMEERERAASCETYKHVQL